MLEEVKVPIRQFEQGRDNQGGGAGAEMIVCDQIFYYFVTSVQKLVGERENSYMIAVPQKRSYYNGQEIGMTVTI